MRAQFGNGYAESVAKDYVLSALADRTVNQALADGEEAKVVWRAICDAFRVPERLRYAGVVRRSVRDHPPRLPLHPSVS